MFHSRQIALFIMLGALVACARPKITVRVEDQELTPAQPATISWYSKHARRVRGRQLSDLNERGGNPVKEIKGDAGQISVDPGQDTYYEFTAQGLIRKDRRIIRVLPVIKPVPVPAPLIFPDLIYKPHLSDEIIDKATEPKKSKIEIPQGTFPPPAMIPTRTGLLGKILPLVGIQGRNPNPGAEITFPRLSARESKSSSKNGTAWPSVFFDTNCSNPKSDQERALDEIKALIAQQPYGTLLIIGRCDRRGTSSFNYRLGLRRAQAIAKRLPNAVRNSLKISLSSCGSDGVKGTEEGNPQKPPSYANDRRVELSFSRGEKLNPPCAKRPKSSLQSAKK